MNTLPLSLGNGEPWADIENSRWESEEEFEDGGIRDIILMKIFVYLG